MGLSTADSLSRKGARVTVVDTRNGPGQGTSFSNSGMLHPSQAMPWFPVSNIRGAQTHVMRAILDLALESKSLVLENIQRLGLNQSASRRGCFKMYENLENMKFAQDSYIKTGINCEIVTGTSRPFGRPSLYFPQDGFGDAYRYCRALEKSLTTPSLSRSQQDRRGTVRFIYGVKNTRLIMRGDNVRGVTFDQNEIKADHVVIAAGAKSPEIARQLGIRLPITAIRGFAVNFMRPNIVLPMAPVMHAASHSALSQFSDHIRLSGTVNASDETVLIDAWRKISPTLIKALGPPKRVWHGDRPVSQDGTPYIGRTAIPRLWVNAGHGHMGWTLSAGSGNLLAKMLIEGYSDTRFSVPNILTS